MSVRDFKQATAFATKCIDDKFTSKTDKPKFDAYRETSLMLEGESLSRLAWPEAKVFAFRQMASAAPTCPAPAMASAG